jgi:phage terminase Nu1 subunit (DNA packaging protein)
MDARDLCRNLNCSPALLAAWLEQGCPVDRDPPFAWFDLEEVSRWLAERGIQDWPKEDDHDLDVTILSILKAVERRELTPWEAEKVLFLTGVLV